MRVYGEAFLWMGSLDNLHWPTRSCFFFPLSVTVYVATRRRRRGGVGSKENGDWQPSDGMTPVGEFFPGEPSDLSRNRSGTCESLSGLTHTEQKGQAGGTVRNEMKSIQSVSNNHCSCPQWAKPYDAKSRAFFFFL